MEVTPPQVDDCCSTDQLSDDSPCPSCATTGPIVGTHAVRPHRLDATDGPWQYCATEDCPVVYYLGADTITANQLRTQVAHKGLDKPTPVCFCFSHTEGDLANDLDANDGLSTIKADIKTTVANGFCACEHLNPSGQCCLADIHRTLKTIQTDPVKIA